MEITSFNGFLHLYKVKNKATSNIKLQQIFSSIGLNNADMYLRGELFSTDVGIISLHQPRGTHSVAYMNEIFFDS